MKQKKRSRVGAGLLVLTLLSGTLLSGFTYQEGMQNVYYQAKSEIYEDVYYIEQLGGHSENGIERAFIVTADTRNPNVIPYVFEGEVTGKYTLDAMINTIEGQGYKVLAGINGDLYDTGSGTPKGLTIHDGKIKTSGYAPEYVISFSKDGTASLASASLGYHLKGMINVPTTVDVPPAEGEIADPSAPPVDPAQPQTETINVPTEFTYDIGFFNVPHGAANGLHLFNRQFGPSTKTSGNAVEVILDAGSAIDAQPAVGEIIRATVVEVRPSTHDTPIGDGQLVLSTPANSASSWHLAQMIPGTQVELSVSDYSGGVLTESKDALGVYYLIYNNGQYMNNGTNVNARTAIGIKPDGTTMMYVVDGGKKNAGYSGGLGLTDMAKHLVSLGCTTVVNLDGGGSTMMSVRKGGVESKAALKTKPADGTQRKVTNGLFFVYAGVGNGRVENLHLYPSQPLAMPGADIQLTAYASDSRYEPTSLQGSISYEVNEGNGRVSGDGIFTAGDKVGKATVYGELGGVRTSVDIDVYDDITYTTNVQNLVLDPGKSADINVTAKHGYAPIASKDSLFTWSCDPHLGTIDENGLFQAVDQSGVTGNIYVAYKGEQAKTIPVQVGVALDFVDTKDHWAKDAIGNLASRGIVNGMGNNTFMPESAVTRAQFLTMLAKTIYGLDLTQSAPAGFADVSEAEWYYHVVNWGFAQGIVQGFDETTFGPDANITREQMAVMLRNFTRSSDLILADANGGGTAFVDQDAISEWAQEAVTEIVAAGIMGGYPEGDFQPGGQATRAQAATVIYKYCNVRDNIAKAK